MIGNPDFHTKQLKIIIKFPLQNFAEKPQAFLLCWYLQCSNCPSKSAMNRLRLSSYSLPLKNAMLCYITYETKIYLME